MKSIKRVGIFPWATNTTNPYQELTKKGLEDNRIEVVKPEYHSFLPLYHCLFQVKDVDAIFLDWVHPIYTSPNYSMTLAKTILGSFERLLIKNRNVPIIWNLHNLHRHDKLHQNLERWSFRKLAGVVDGIRVFNEVSKVRVQQYLSLPSDLPVEVIPHGHYIDIFQPYLIQAKRNKFGISEDEKVLLIFGEIRSGKGIEKFIRAFNSQNQEGFILIIAGNPQTEAIRQEIEALCKEKNNIILILRRLSDQELGSLFTIVNYAVFPYDYILNSGAALTALSCSLPIIGNNLPAFEELLSSKFSYLGRIQDSNVLGSILSKIKSLSNSEYQTQRQLALARAKSLSWTSIGAALIDFASTVKYHR